MPTPVRGSASNSRYFLRFAGTAGLLVSGTLVLVLYVLPQRYVLSSGFREGALNFPDPSTPFEPMNPVLFSALPAPPAQIDETVPRGPAEIFWARVIPLLNARRYDSALPLFEQYLEIFPDDRDVRREYALTLAAAGRGEEAVPILEDLLESSDDPELRLVLARILRDEGRLGDASVHYSTLMADDPANETLALEWAQALAWVENYDAAEEVLLAALEHNPNSVPLRVELARLYYYTDRLTEAEELLGGMSDQELASADGIALRDDVAAALFVPPDPEVEPPPPPTLLELAIGAREDGDLDRAAALFLEALDENPEDVAAWQAYADFLQYELEDFPGALEALTEVERLMDGGDSTLQYRMAQLEVWTERTDLAQVRLEALLLLLDAEALAAAQTPADPPPTDTLEAVEEPAGDPVTRADVYALLGEIHRWDGERLPAVARYESALGEDPEHELALEGLAIIRAEVDRQMIDAELPGLGAIASSFADTDDFARLDLGGEWRGIHEDWVWRTLTAARLLDGFDASGATAEVRGVFAELEGARWWRWGTIRTGLHMGVQDVLDDNVELAVGASARFMGGAGRRTDVGFDHEPAYTATNTLQSVFARVVQDRFSASHNQPLGQSWSFAVTGEAASLDHTGVAGADRNLRIQGGLSVGRAMSRTLSLGVSARALTYTDAAPNAGGFPLYWDPNSSISVGPYAEYLKPFSTYWEFLARLNPGLAFIDERGASGGEGVPDLSGTVGLAREGGRYRTAVRLFYGQGRFDGYRSYGMDLSFSARGWLGRGGGG